MEDEHFDRRFGGMGATGRRWFLRAGLASPLAAFAPTPAWAAPLVNGWREAIIITPDPAPWVETLTRIGGWEVLASAAADDSLNRLWSLPGDARAQQILMHNAGTSKGYLRLVCVAGAAQTQIRPDDQAWETGGVSALDLRVVDIDTTRAALHARGWRAPSDPVRYHAYNVEVIQWAPVSPDGVRLSFIQRIAPPLSGWPELKRWSRAANAAIVTKDIAAGAAFFTTGLGLPMAGHTNTVGGNGPNVMGLPWALARSLPVDIRGFAAGPAGDSAVELISMPGAAGRDFAAAARPPNFGIAALRGVSADVRGLAAAMGASVMAIEIPPHGPCLGFTITAPDGVRLEIIQPIG